MSFNRNSNSPYIKGFDGLRAISIICVILSHLGYYDSGIAYFSLHRHYYLFSGASGVMIFFTISGFLITTLLIREKVRTGTIHIKHFLIRRFLRLFPALFIFYILLIILMLFHFIDENYTAIFLSFFYCYNYVFFTHYTNELAHTWSLSVEEQFYLLWPFVLRFILQIKQLILISLLIILACLFVFHFKEINLHVFGKDYILTHYSKVERWFIPACLPIMMGSIIGLLFYKYNTFIFQKFHLNKWIPLFCIIIYTFESYFPFWNPTLSFLFMPFSIGTFLVWIVVNQQAHLVTLLEWKPLAFVGKISYGIYVFQGLFLTTGPAGTLAIQKFPLNLILTLLVALLSYYFIEKPVLNYKARFTV